MQNIAVKLQQFNLLAFEWDETLWLILIIFLPGKQPSCYVTVRFVPKTRIFVGLLRRLPKPSSSAVCQREIFLREEKEKMPAKKWKPHFSSFRLPWTKLCFQSNSSFQSTAITAARQRANTTFESTNEFGQLLINIDGEYIVRGYDLSNCQCSK